jgi:light-dependent protochlorophyllide reductase
MVAAKKTVIITGGNTGLGYQCAKAILKSDSFFHILIACRNPDKAANAIEKLKKETGSSNITSIKLDLSSLSSVRKFTDEFANAKLPPLHAVVCNAGMQSLSRTSFTEDGYEITFGVNHLGHFLLVNKLLKIFAEPGRIVFVSSGTHDPEQKTGMPEPLYISAKLLAHPADNNENFGLIGRRNYTTSKLCNIYSTYELAKRIANETGKKITVNAFDPGMLPGTGLARDYGIVSRFIWKYIFPVMTLFVRNVNSVSKSGNALASLVTNPKLNETTGKYFEGENEIKSSNLSYSKINAQDLWNTSIELTKLQKDETILSL